MESVFMEKTLQYTDKGDSSLYSIVDGNHNDCHKGAKQPGKGITDEKPAKHIHNGMKRSLSKHDVPEIFRSPHVEFGFRPVHQPWSYYIFSMFSLHNEFMNIWTHLIPLLLQMYQIYSIGNQLDFINDPYTWPLLAGMFSGIAVFLCSTIAHCCHSKSEFVHYVFFMIDYAGIALYAAATAILSMAYCTSDEQFNFASPYFYPVAITLPTMMFLCSASAKINTDTIHQDVQTMLKLLPCVMSYFIFDAPAVYRSYVCYMYNTDCSSSIPYHVTHFVCCVLSGLLFSSEIPQKWNPGKFDIFLHSHQLFHIAIAVSIFTKTEAVMSDFRSREYVIRSRQMPTISSVFGPVIIVVVLEFIGLIYFTKVLHKRFSSIEKNKEKQT